MKSKLSKILPILLVLLSFPIVGQVRLPKLISDGMVLQRDAEINVWGWAAPNEKIVVHLKKARYQTTATPTGDWTIRLPRQQAGGPYTLTITASNVITINDVLIGDVWLCSGQSNMELSMQRVSPLYQTEIATAENKAIRYFAVPQKYNFNTPQTDLAGGYWQSVNPTTILKFSAVAYFFARELYAKNHIPIGLINASLGGSPVEAWISEKSLEAFPTQYQEAQRFKDSTLITRIEQQDKVRIDAWYTQLRQKDEGYQNKQAWYDPAVNTSDWKTMKVPGYWADGELGDVNGVVWFRKDITVPASMLGKPAKLLLGRIVDADSVFVNGVWVGTTGYQYPPRRYTVPATLLRQGKNTLVVRLVSNAGRGGFVADKPYELVTEGKTLDLRGHWQYKLGARMEPLASQTFIRWKPVGLFNAMISPLLPYRIKGAIWYQGEANAERPLEYRELFPTLIKDWRKQWNQGDFPFLFVQLANYMESKNQPGESDWALLREAQFKTLALPNTGMAVAIDIGEWNDIHPLNKKDVGIRLAKAAQQVAYGDTTIVSSGPLYQSMKIQGNRAILTFTHTGAGLVTKGGKLTQFAVAGQDKQFVWAKAIIKKNTIVVWSDKISKPVAVRYAWADNPQGANLYNTAGLPASPFRTDDWVTQ